MTPNVYAALKQLHRDGSLPLAEDPSLSIAMLWERFQVLGKSTSPPSFSGNGAESFQNAMAEAWVNLSPTTPAPSIYHAWWKTRVEWIRNARQDNMESQSRALSQSF